MYLLYWNLSSNSLVFSSVSSHVLSTHSPFDRLFDLTLTYISYLVRISSSLILSSLVTFARCFFPYFKRFPETVLGRAWLTRQWFCYWLLILTDVVLAILQCFSVENQSMVCGLFVTLLSAIFFTSQLLINPWAWVKNGEEVLVELSIASILMTTICVLCGFGVYSHSCTMLLRYGLKQVLCILACFSPKTCSWSWGVRFLFKILF